MGHSLGQSRSKEQGMQVMEMRMLRYMSGERGAGGGEGKGLPAGYN